MAHVLVAGGATGIGLAAVRAFRAQGDDVLLADLNEAGARAAVAEPLAGRGLAFGCDLGQPEAAPAAVEAAVRGLGGLEVVVGNAGVLLAAPLEEWTVADWDRSVNVNLRAPFLLAQAAAPHLTASGDGCLLFTSSTAAFRGVAGIHAYAATKGGLVNLVRSLAAELSPRGVRVNSICPGLIDTPFNDPFWASQPDPRATLARLVERVPSGRQGVPDDVVGAILFLVSPAARYITGQTLAVDGGYLAV